MRYRKPWLLVLLLTVVIWTLGLRAKSAVAELSIEAERKMGEQFLKAAREQLRFIEDPEVVGFVNEVGQRLVNHLGGHTFPYHFYVVDSEVLNAFAAPAGHVFVNRGLLEIMDKEAELAAILAHEIAHVQSRHIALRLARAQKLSLATLGGVLAGLFLGNPQTGQALIAGTLAGSASLQLSYSRQDEEEADRKGLRYLEAAGYSPRGMVEIMQKMGQQSWKSGGHIPTYLATHPGVPERLNYLMGTLESRPHSARAAPRQKRDLTGFRMMQARLLGSYQDTSVAGNILRRWLRDRETRTAAWYGLALLERRQGKMAEAVASFKRAISARPDLPLLLAELGETHFEMGNLDKAVAVLKSALSLKADQPGALYTLGRCFLEQGRAAKARTYLRRAAQLDDRLPAIHYHLGLAYARLNQLAEAHYQFGLHYQQQGSWSSAQFHFKEALRLARSPERKEKLRQALREVEERMRAGEAG